MKINEEDRKTIDNYASKYKDYPTPKNALMRGVLLGAEFGYHLRDAEVERWSKENEDAWDQFRQYRESFIKQSQELAALKKQVEEARRIFDKWQGRFDPYHDDYGTPDEVIKFMDETKPLT